jgi:hypothetical protein
VETLYQEAYPMSARLYNWKELNKGRPYPECLVLEDTPIACATYMHEFDPEGDYLCFEQGDGLFANAQRIRQPVSA